MSVVKQYILALDQGTTSSRALVFDVDGAVVAMAQAEFPQYFPEPGWVEHDAVEIWDGQLAVARDALSQVGAKVGEVVGLVGRAAFSGEDLGVAEGGISASGSFNDEARQGGLEDSVEGEGISSPDHSGQGSFKVSQEGDGGYGTGGRLEAGHAVLAGIGITNQRETTVVWDRETGVPVYRAIVWQDRRTAGLCADLKARGLEPLFREKTGLVLDAYFSGTKLAWILDHVPGVRERAERGDLCFGTVDSWLIWNLSGGKVHATDASNASRTLLYNLVEGVWDTELLEILNIPASLLPVVKDSSGWFCDVDADLLMPSGANASTAGEREPAAGLSKGDRDRIVGGDRLSRGLSGSSSEKAIPVLGVAGDQQAALFGQGCRSAGLAKNTYGTGCFLLMHTGSHVARSEHGLLSTIAWQLDGRVEYALEGSVFIAGAAIQWLRDGLEILAGSSEAEGVALSVEDNGGVFFVPAFAGLGTPYWNMDARGALFGLSRGSSRAHFVRAALEAMAYQSREVLDAMEADAGVSLGRLRVDGGASRNDFLMQFQADLLDTDVVRPANVESTAWGAACLAGLAAGLWDLDALDRLGADDAVFSPGMDPGVRDRLWHGWKRAVKATLFHADSNGND